MGLKNLGTADYHVYDIADSKISNISFTPTTPSCPPKTVYRVNDCDVPIRKNFPEPGNVQAKIDEDTKVHYEVGELLTYQIVRELPANGEQELKILNPFSGGEPKWEYEFKASEDLEIIESIGLFLQDAIDRRLGGEVLNLEENHRNKIAEYGYRYFNNASPYKQQIIRRSVELLKRKSDKGAYLLKSYDFAYKTALSLYGVRKAKQVQYLLKSKIWLRPTLITTDDGVERSECDISTDDGVKKRCAKAFIFINPTENTIAGVVPSFSPRIDLEINEGVIQWIKDNKFKEVMDTTNSNWTDWAQAASLEYENFNQGIGFNPSPYTAEEGLRVVAGLSNTTPGEIFLGYGFAYGREGQPDERIAIKNEKIIVIVNPNNIAANASAIEQRRDKMREREQAQKNARDAQLNAHGAAISAGGPAAPTETTNTEINISQPIATEYPNRRSVLDATTNAQGKATEALGNITPD